MSKFFEGGEYLEIENPAAASDVQDSARNSDINGFIEIQGNPISKVGIFEYSGAQVNHPDRSRHGEIFKVLRPEDELSDPECIKSFRLLPFVDDHAMLGSEDIGAMPAERKGVQGFIGEQVYFDSPYLRANLKIVSESLKNLVDNGKEELSPGYRCTYEFTPGVWDGQHYDVVQRKIRGNHLALVDEGRTGSDVSVLDRMTFTIDTKEIVTMKDEKEAPEGGLARLKELVEMIKPLLEEHEESAAIMADMGLMPKSESSKDEDMPINKKPEGMKGGMDMPPDKENMDMEHDEKIESMDSKINFLITKIEALEAGSLSMDSKMVGTIADRDILASKLSGFVGTFDHSRMTAQGVAEYGVEKLSIPCEKGTEQVALQAYMYGRTPESKQPTFAADYKGTNILEGWGGNQ